jgi:hypothetical protein
MKRSKLTRCFLIVAALAARALHADGELWTDPAIAAREDADFAVQGEYRSGSMGAQIVALGGGTFEIFVMEGGLPGAGWETGKSRLQLKGEKGRFSDASATTTATLEDATLTVKAAAGSIHELKRIERQSPTLNAKPPVGAVVLFDGTSIEAWQNAKMENGHLMAHGSTSKQHFASYALHVEFRTPYKPKARGQERGNSGVYQSGRWETQVLDSFGLTGEQNECGGLYSIAKPRLNMCLPPLSWQTYDVVFTAAKFDAAGQRTAWPRITVRLNGVLIHDDVELAKDFTTAAPVAEPLTTPDGPIFLQEHGNPVAFRNIWIVPSK